MAEVKLPMVGGVSKKALLIGGAGAAVLVAFLYLRKKNTSTAPATTDTSGTGTDGTTSDYVDPGLQDTTQGPTYGATGYYDPNSGQWVFGNTGTGQAAATTNAAWAQQAITYLVENNAVTDAGTLNAALGLYLTGQAVTADQESLIDQAIAVEGYPPVSGANGYPPAIRTQSSGSGGGITGGGGSGSPPTVNPGGPPAGLTPPPTVGGGSWSFPAPGGLHVTQNSGNGYHLAWNAVTGPNGQHPSTYTVATYNSAGQLVDQFTSGATSTLEFGRGGKGLPKGTYHTNVWANGGPKAPAHSTVTVTLSR